MSQHNTSRAMYSDQNFFGLIQTDGFNFYNDKFSNKPDGQPDKALEFVTNLSQQVPSRPFMFATAASPPDAIYSLVQCTMDVSKDGCKKCLQDVIQRIKVCCSLKRGWRYFAPSCSVRYETYLFFNGTKDREELEGHHCPYDASTASLVFNTNLYRLLLTLTTNAPASGFFSSSFGDDHDIVYGLVPVEVTLILRAARNVNIAWNDLTEACPNKTQAILWYRRCQLRYSNESFFGTADTKGIYIANDVDDNIGNQSHSLEVIYRLVKTASEEKLMFASDELQVNESERRYYYAQCTRDLDSSTCHDCLKELIQEVMECCINKKGWIYFAASCNMRYEAYAFFNTNKVVAPVTQPNPSPQLIPATSPIPPKGVVPGNVSKEGKEAKNSRVLAIGITVAFLGFVLLGCCIFYLLHGRKKPKRKEQQSQDALLDNLGPPTGTELLNTNISGGSQMETQELPLISLDTILHATNNFSSENKLGEGGFGAVYKGILADEKEIAVKRLSKGSSQGLMEFKNEVILIVKLQHKNLVRLLFCCIEKGEKLLVYEYMPNTSLDVFLLVNQVKRAELHWRIRLNIVTGIARGLLYLHEDSRLKVIHRDLKASNVLLDHEMNPKISDFGLARAFGENQEYAMDGLFSVKSDVFSFGVLLLEIISGRRNNRSHLPQNAQSLLAYAWQLWCDEKEMELIDPMLIDSSPMDHVLRFLHIGLLCVQEVASERPTMSSVVLMLGSESMILPQPSQPPLYLGKRGFPSELSHSNARTPSSNETLHKRHDIMG
ncbi:cysteine-rich receptor-like protein kinase 15 [Cinnamomum micranthum f. kanehirae]|uniref:non-specific serine/threonine protein kinase n=1 Tax=Cinnamomum micranthum f. kanehirae TaxID=337451 RepID=A0A443PBZ9_9MAGN|nr:cysteine-rich receptor-like protein kinase 15 [Cinnamomum micranthum f. kanehirae]